MNVLQRYLANRFEVSHGKHAGLLGMEGLRGFAVFLVFLVHFFSLAEPWLPPDSMTYDIGHALWRIGNTGVDLFFVLSGYLIYGMLIAKPRPLVPYFRRRVERIYPTFLVVFAIYVTLSLAMPSSNRIPSDFGDAFVYLLQNLLMLPGMFDIEPLIKVAWSLSYEFFYYLAIPSLIVALRMRSWPRNSRLAFFTLIALGIFIYALNFNQYVRLMMFIAGILLFESPTFRATGLFDRLGLIAPVVAFLGIFASSDGGGLWRYIWLFFAYYLLCYAAFRESGLSYRIFTWAPLRWLGNMSYSYYLVHGLALNVAFVVLARLFPPSGHAPWMYWALMPPMFAFTLIPSAILFLTVERPYSIMPRQKRATPKPMPLASPYALQNGFVGDKYDVDGKKPTE
jgi:exopolysaccharide production protein ExoZ